MKRSLPIAILNDFIADKRRKVLFGNNKSKSFSFAVVRKLIIANAVTRLESVRFFE